MARPGFLNDNTFRTYPFIDGRQGDIPDCLIADFGSTMLAGSGYVEGTHEVWLEWVRRLGSTLEFSFRSNAPGVADQALMFQRSLSDAEHVTSFSWAQPALSADQLTGACDCGADVLCNGGFDETETTTTTPAPGTTTSTTPAPDACDKYPGSAVYGWEVDSGVTQTGGVLRIESTPLGVKQASQQVDDLLTGQDARLTIDLVSNNGNTNSFVLIELAGPTKTDVLTSVTAKTPGEYTLTAEVPSPSTLFVNIKVYNADATTNMVVTLDDATLQPCVSDTSSFAAEPPDESCCPADSLWEGFLVTGDVSCVLDLLKDCAQVGGGPGGAGSVDVLFLTDTTGSMGSYIATVVSVFTPLASSVETLLPAVDFRWAAAEYRDYEDGGDYASGWKVNQAMTSSIAAVQGAISAWSASGGGDIPEQQLSALRLAADEWLTTLAGRSGAQKIVVWAGDVTGWEDGAKGFGYPKLSETVTALVAAGVKVVAINPSAAGSGIDGVQTGSASRQASTITDATGGDLVNNVTLSDSESVAAIVANAIFTTVDDPGLIVGNSLDGPAYVEPSRTKNLSGSYVRSLAIVNSDRTRAETPDGCRDYCWPFEVRDHYVAGECLNNTILFKSGCNSNIRIDSGENAIVFDGEIGAGDCDCEDRPLALDEGPPSGRNSLDGAPGCGDVIRSFNGSGKRFFEFQSGRGVTVQAVPDEHRVIIDINLGDLALCPDLAADQVVQCIPPSSLPCDCGPAEGYSEECPDEATTATPSTTTTAAPGCGGPCEWIWSHPAGAASGDWIQIGGACTEDCTCVKPAADGTFSGETRSTDCLRPGGPCLLTNPEFEAYAVDGSNIVTAVTGWTIVGTSPNRGELLISEEGFAFAPIQQQGNVLRLRSTSSGDAEIRQSFQVTPGATYEVTAYVSGVSGETSWGVLHDGTPLSAASESSQAGEDGDSGSFVTRTFTAPIVASSLTLFFKAANDSCGNRAILDVAGVCVGYGSDPTTTTTAAP